MVSKENELSTFEDKLVFTIEGSSEIDLDTLAKTLTGTSQALKRIAIKSDAGENQTFLVNDIRRGSFKIYLETAIDFAAFILPAVPSALSLFVDVLNLKEHLDGSTAKDIVVHENSNTVSVKNSSNVVQTFNYMTFNVYTEDSKIDESITAAMKAIENDPNTSGISINKNDEDNNIKVYDTSKLAKKVDISKLKQKNREISEQRIKLTKIDFVGKSMWKGILLGKEIQFYMTDEPFRENIENYKFTKGTVIEAEIVTEYVTKDNGEIYEKTVKYEVTKINQVINVEEEQLRL